MKASSNIVPKVILREKQLETLERVAGCLEAAYGPFASTTAIRKGVDDTNPDKTYVGAGSTVYTKDGHTILKHVNVSRPIEMTTIEDLISVTEETVKKVGDGTTSAIELSYLVFKAMYDACIKYGISENQLVAELRATTEKVIALIDQKKKEATLEDIYKIAFISTNGNADAAEGIRQIYEKCGMGVHIDVGVSNTGEHEVKFFDGMTFDAGYFNEAFINNPAKATCDIRDANIYVFEDAIDTPEMIALYDTIVGQNVALPIQQLMQLQQKGITAQQVEQLRASGQMPTIVPTVILSIGYGTDMRSQTDTLIAQFTGYAAESRPNLLTVTNIHDKRALMDLCLLSGAKSIKKYNQVSTMEADQAKGLAPTAETIHEFAGKAEFVSASKTMTKIINPAKMYAHDCDGKIAIDDAGNPILSAEYKGLVDNCEAQLASMQKAKTDITDIYLMKKRLNSLKGNLVQYLVGGVSMADRDSVKDLIEDAVLNCRSAATDGVGFGANFEALNAIHHLVKEREDAFDEDTKNKIISGEFTYYSMENILMDAYTSLATILYKSAVGGNEQVATQLVGLSLVKGSPCNLKKVSLVNGKLEAGTAFDGSVLSSIKSDQVILNAIAKIIGLTFATNQYFTATYGTNLYEQEAESANKIKAIAEIDTHKATVLD